MGCAQLPPYRGPIGDSWQLVRVVDKGRAQRREIRLRPIVRGASIPHPPCVIDYLPSGARLANAITRTCATRVMFGSSGCSGARPLLNHHVKRIAVPYE